MIIPTMLLLLGLALLIVGAYYLVDSSSALGRKYGLSELVIGLTVVAFGTSSPELIVNLVAAFAGKGDVAFANVIGSNNFNLLVILGLSGLIGPLAVQDTTIRKEIPFSFLAAFILWLLANNFFLGESPVLGRMDGLGLLLLFGGFMYYIFRQLGNASGNPAQKQEGPSLLNAGLWIIGSLALLIIGGRLLVINATHLAKAWGVSESVIGITIVAAGTSLPELATSIVAAFKKNNAMAIGNVVGSNIFNIFFILGLTAVAQPLSYTAAFNIDLYLLAAGTVLLYVFCRLGVTQTVSRIEAGILLALYAVYTLYLFEGLTG